MITIISFRCVFEKLIIIMKKNVNDLNKVTKAKVILMMISKLFKYNVVGLKIIIDEM